jgi:hypothetical protein
VNPKKTQKSKRTLSKTPQPQRFFAWRRTGIDRVQRRKKSRSYMTGFFKIMV